MTENSSHDKLEGFVKNTLQNADVPFNPAHWEEMEQKLNALPQAGSQKLSVPPKKVITAAAVVLGAVILIYGIVKFSGNSSSDVPENNEAINTEPIITPPAEPTLAPSVTNVQTTVPITETLQEKVEEKTEEQLKEEKREKRRKEKAEAAAKADSIKRSVENKSDSANVNKAPTFGDMIDPQKGFIKQTNEADDVQKAAEEKIKSGETEKVITDIKNDSVKSQKVFGGAVVAPDSTGAKKKKKRK